MTTTTMITCSRDITITLYRNAVTRAIRAAKLVARDTRVPRSLRWVAAIGLLPIPGPVDEAVLLLVAPVFMIFYRAPMRDAWEQAAQSGSSPDLSLGGSAPYGVDARRPR